MNSVPQRFRATLIRSVSAAAALTLTAASWLIPAQPAAADDAVAIPDANLAACISARLVKESLAPDFTAANLAKLTQLSCTSSGIADVTGLDSLTGLTRLTVNTTATNLSPLSGLSNLQYLFVNDSAVTDVSPIAALPNLTELVLAAPLVTSYSIAVGHDKLLHARFKLPLADDLLELAKLPALFDLELADPSAAARARVGDLTGVTRLRVTTYTADGLSGLAVPPGVTTLWLNGPEFTDLTGLEPSSARTSLTVVASKVTSLDGIDKLPHLTQIQVHAGTLHDISAINDHADLISLDFSQTAVDDLSALAGLSGLTTLNVPYTNVSDLGPLTNLTALENLNLNSTSVADLSPLSGHTALQTLDLTSTSVADLSPLSGDTALRTLHLNSTSVADLSPLSGHTALRTLDLTKTVVRGLGPLTGIPLTWLKAPSLGLTDVTALAALGPNAQVWLEGNNLRDFSPLPDDAVVSMNQQQVTGITAVTGVPVDLGLRLANGEAVCPDAQRGLTCEDGVVTFSENFGDIWWRAGTTFWGFATVTRAPSISAPRLAVQSSDVWPPTLWFSFPQEWNPYPTSWTEDWYRDGALVQSETSFWPYGTHQLAIADLDHEITLCTTGRGGLGGTRRTCSAPLVVPHATFPSLQVRISGRAQVRKWLFVRTVQLPAGTKATYTWYRNGHKIKGAHQPFHWVSPADRGKRLRVRITVSKPGYHTVSATTAQTARVKKWSKE